MADTPSAPLTDEQIGASLLEAAAALERGEDPQFPAIADDPDTRESEQPAEDAKPVAEVTKTPAVENPSKPETPPESKETKEQARKDKTWREINEEKERLRAEREEIERLRGETAVDPKATKEAEQYEEIARQFDEEGNEAMAKAAREKAREAMSRSQAKSEESRRQEFVRKWNATYADQCDKNPELSDANSPLYKGVAALLQKETILTHIPDGIAKAVEIVGNQIQAGRVSGLQAELDAAKAEIAELNKKLAIGGSDPAVQKGDKTFEDMTDAEQGEFLRRQAVALEG
jgi:hypothetical protein